MNRKENIYNIPNFISLYRLLSVPFLAYIVLQKKENLFFYWFLFNLFTDVLDGFIARTFNLKTKFGAKLDSFADFAMYLLAMFALIYLKWEELEPYKYSLYLLIFYYVFIDIFSFIKFGEVSSLHLYFSKFNGLLQAVFFLIIFGIGFNKLLYFAVFFFASLSFLENMYFLLKIDKMRSDLKGIYWLQKNTTSDK